MSGVHHYKVSVLLYFIELSTLNNLSQYILCLKNMMLNQFTYLVTRAINVCKQCISHKTVYLT